MERIIFIFMVVFMGAALAQAQTPEQSERLIARYVKAVDLKDPLLIDAAWEQISTSNEALHLMKTKYPRAYRSFEYWRLKRELEELKARRFLNSSFTTLSEEGGFSTSREAEKSNSEKARDFPNQNRRSNRASVLAFPNQESKSNQDTVRDLPNQEQTSNQDRIRNRLRNVR